MNVISNLLLDLNVITKLLWACQVPNKSSTLGKLFVLEQPNNEKNNSIKISFNGIVFFKVLNSIKLN